MADAFSPTEQTVLDDLVRRRVRRNPDGTRRAAGSSR
jgi:hypothetical protein